MMRNKNKVKVLLTSIILIVSIMISFTVAYAAVLPIGHYEDSYSPNSWNSSPNSLQTVNCYAYAVLKVCSVTFGCKIQPGDLANQRFTQLTETNIINAVKADIGSSNIYKTTKTATPPAGWRKVALVIAPNEDYHWYEQNSEGFWSHKPGFDNVTNKDASKVNIIWDPETCNRKYVFSTSTLNNNNGKSYYTLDYSTFCGYYMTNKGALYYDSHGNAIETATTVSVGSNTSGNIDYTIAGRDSADVDFFKFTTSTAGTYTIKTTGSTDTVGTLYSSSGSYITENDDNGGINFGISSSLAANTTYYVKVRCYYSDRTGAYTFSVTKN